MNNTAQRRCRLKFLDSQTHAGITRATCTQTLGFYAASSAPRRAVPPPVHLDELTAAERSILSTRSLRQLDGLYSSDQPTDIAERAYESSGFRRRRTKRIAASSWLAADIYPRIRLVQSIGPMTVMRRLRTCAPAIVCNRTAGARDLDRGAGLGFDNDDN
jgi:hypothetical protein